MRMKNFSFLPGCTCVNCSEKLTNNSCASWEKVFILSGKLSKTQVHSFFCRRKAYEHT